jgi:nitroreductase
MATAHDLIKEQARASLQHLPPEMDKNGPFAKRIAGLAEHGVPALHSAPYFVVVAERRGIPPVEFESLGHCLENMWLKATALGLGFQLLSVTKMLSESRAFFELVDLEWGQFVLNGCAIGYPQQTPGEKQLYPMADVVKWL